MNYKKHLPLIEAIMLIVWIITLIIFLSQIWTNGTKCMNSPIQYGVNTLSDKNNDSLTCRCTFDSSPNYEIFVDKTHNEIKQVQGLKGG